jgi:uncharacterized cofD-like protein
MTSRIPLGGGPRIVAIGGGTGLSTMLRGLKYFTRNLTAVVTVADDGGGSGVLRQELGMLPPGDIRNCIQALANVEPVMEELLAYRFSEGALTGQSFGNLFLAALNGISSSFDQAVSRMGDVLAITGKVLPVTTADVQLVADFENGSSVVGESRISSFKRQQGCRIHRVRLLPERPAALPEALEAIRQADVLILGPGSLYTSVIPNLLVEGISDAIASFQGLRIYVANIMTQVGETEDYDLADHLSALFAHSRPGLVNLCLANSTPIPENIQQRYQKENAAPILPDQEKLAALGVELVTRPLTSEPQMTKTARHDSMKLASALMELIEQRYVRTSTADGFRYILEQDH